MPRTQRQEVLLMEGGGFYSEHNPHSLSTVERVIPLLCEAVASMTSSLGDDSVFTFFDVGSADGRAGSFAASAIIERVKSTNKAKPVHIVFVDQPENDFSAIFTEHQRQLSDSADDVYVSVVGRSFYKQCLPAESVDVSFSSIAVHWPDLDTDAEYTPTPPTDKEPMGSSLKWRNKNKTRNDWERFLLHRTRELKNNGQLVVVHLLFPSDLKEHSPSDEAYSIMQRTYNSFFDVFGELQKKGRLSPDENFSNPEKFRTKEELEAPFQDDHSPVRQAGLSLCFVEKVAIPCPITKSFRDGKLSKEEYGQSLALTIRSWSYSLVANSLRTERSKEEKEELVEEIYRRLGECITAKVPNVGFPYPVLIFVAKKMKT